MKKIVSIGDSIIQGKEATDAKGWIWHFSRKLRSDGVDFQIENRGKGGDTILKVKSRLYRDCMVLNPDFVILGIGVNDSRFRPSLNSNEVDLEIFGKELYKVSAAVASKTNAKILLVGQVPVVDKLVDPYKPDKHYKRRFQFDYELKLYEVCLKIQGLYLENFARWLAKGEDFIEHHLKDGLHPNDDGHRELAEYAYWYLRTFYKGLWKK